LCANKSYTLDVWNYQIHKYVNVGNTLTAYLARMLAPAPMPKPMKYPSLQIMCELFQTSYILVIRLTGSSRQCTQSAQQAGSCWDTQT